METTETQQTSLTPLDSIKLCDAKTFTNTWQSENNGLPKAFVIPILDFVNLLTELELINIEEDGRFALTEMNGTEAAIRAYIGVDPDSPFTLKQKLFLVGALKLPGSSHFKEIIQEEKNPIPGWTPSGSGVFDFTTPCPSHCDDDSPLNH
jgi:hypothetical protein